MMIVAIMTATNVMAQEDLLNSRPIDISGTLKQKPVRKKTPKKNAMVSRMERQVEALKQKRKAQEKAVELKAQMKLELIRLKKAKLEQKRVNQTFKKVFSKLDQLDSELGGDDDDFDDLDLEYL